jgi:uncharacterized protein YcfL
MRTIRTAFILLLLLVLLPACSSNESNKNESSASSLKIVDSMKEAGEPQTSAGYMKKII